MSAVSFVAFYGGKWSAGGNYADYRMMGVVADIDISLAQLVQLLIGELRLDNMTKWHLCVNMDRTSFTKGLYELKKDRDVLWYLNMARGVRDNSCALIVSDVPVVGSSAEAENEDELNEGGRSSIPTVEYFNVSHLPRDYELAVDQMFASKDDLQRAINMVSLRKGFQFRVFKSSTKYFNIVCIDDECKWFLKASVLNKSDIFMIRKYEPEHTCSLDSHCSEHRQASTQMIGECIIPRLIGMSGTIMTPMDIVDFMRMEYGINVNYHKAWRARTCALDRIRGSPADSYALLPLFSKAIKEKNPGSFVDYCADEADRFKYFFMSLSASIEGWQHCRPIISVDGTFLKCTFKGCMIIACTLDGNNQIFPLAMAIVDSEKDASYEWFFIKLKEAIGEREDMVIVSDRHGSIPKGINIAFPDAFHAVCNYHLLQNLRTRFHETAMPSVFHACARAHHTTVFNRHMRKLDRINPGIRPYLFEVGFAKWARCFSRRRRYNLMTTNISESLNHVFKDARGLPICALAEFYRDKLQTWFCDRNAAAQSTFTTLTTWPERMLREHYELSRALQVVAVDFQTFGVTDQAKEYTVYINHKKCSCVVWDHDQIPCVHACAVLRSKNLSPYQFVANYYHTTTLRSTYAGKVMPIGEKDQWIPNEEDEDIKIAPPDQRRSVGRPKTKRIPSVGKFKRKAYSNRCRSCGKVGHDKKVCTNPNTNMDSAKKDDNKSGYYVGS